MNRDTKNTLFALKQQEQDFEWYPTTDEMIAKVFQHCGNLSSMLDIGAGDGRVLEQIDNLCNLRASTDKDGYSRFLSSITKYAIEKSLVHIENMPPDISIVGTDFKAQTLIDKKVAVVFSNPPYSEYEDWATQIIKEANATRIFLILPSRWVSSKLIEAALKLRGVTAKVIWSGDFAEADRQARAKVDIVKIVLERESTNSWDNPKNDDPFDIWFTEYFSGFEQLNHIDDEEHTERPDPIKFLVPGQNLVERLAQLYIVEMNGLLENYKTLSQLDTALLEEIGISADEVKKALRLKIEGLKNKYWHELFDRLDKITNRLTSKSRNSMLEKLNASCNIDFSVDNAYAVVLWVIKNANQYIDQQLVEVFKDLSEPECVKNYKSNLKTWEKDHWRYKDENAHSRYMLEYRIITNRHVAIQQKDGYGWDSTNGLSKSCHDFINDIFTIANNLGFSNMANSLHRQWASNRQEGFNTNRGETLVEIRAFKNGNLHLKLNQDFIKTLNIEASRLLGWIKTAQEAAYEMDLDFDFVKSKLRSNLLFGVREGQKLLAG